MIASSASGQLSDEKLVELAKTDPDQFGILVDRYEQKLHFFGRRISYFEKEDIEDLIQEAFIKIYRGLNSFDESLKFSTWAYQITRNVVIDAIRAKQRRPQALNLEDQDLAKIFQSGADLEREVISKDDLAQVQEVIKKMPFKYQEVLILRFLEERDYEEIMDIVKKPKGTVAALINRGRKILKKELGS